MLEKGNLGNFCIFVHNILELLWKKWSKDASEGLRALSSYISTLPSSLDIYCLRHTYYKWYTIQKYHFKIKILNIKKTFDFINNFSNIVGVVAYLHLFPT